MLKSDVSPVTVCPHAMEPCNGPFVGATVGEDVVGAGVSPTLVGAAVLGAAVLQSAPEIVITAWSFALIESTVTLNTLLVPDPDMPAVDETQD